MLLTLQPVFAGHDRQELLRQLAFAEPTPPRRWNQEIPPELETIVLKAMEKNPNDRYATAQEPAEDLQRFLRDEPIRARRAILWQRLRKWALRHWAIVVTTVVSLLAVLTITAVVLGVSIVQVNEALADRTQAMTALHAQQKETQQALAREIGLRNKLKAAHDKLLQEQKQTKQALYFHAIALAAREWWLNNAGPAERTLDGCQPELRNWEWHYLKRLCRQALLTLQVGKNRDGRVSFCCQGQHLITSGSAVQVWNIKTGQLLRTLSGQVHALSRAWSRWRGRKPRNASC